MINYQAIIDQLTDERVKRILDKLGISYIDKNDYLLMPTVCHNDSEENASLKLYYYKNTHIFYCYTNCLGMSIFTFIKSFYETRNIAYDWFRDIYELITEDESDFTLQNNNIYHSIREDYELKRNYKQLPEYSNNILDSFIKYYPIEWIQDGITCVAMDKFNIRFSPSDNKIIIPHYDINNRLIGIRTRTLNPQDAEIWGKYMPAYIEGKWYSHPLSLNLYGLNITKSNIKQNGIVYVGEGEKFVLQLESFNIPNCGVAVCGSKFNKFGLNILIKECHPQEIILCFDKEELPHQDSYFNHLYSICQKYKIYCNFSFIYDRTNLLSLKDSPTDKGQEIFEKLLKGRVKV